MKNRFEIIPITSANIENCTLSVTGARSLLRPSDIGGPNADSKATTQIQVHWGAGKCDTTDVAGDKNILRNRSMTRAIYEDYGCEPGDLMVAEELRPGEWAMYPARA